MYKRLIFLSLSVTCFLFLSFNLFLFLKSCFLEFWKINKVTPKYCEQRHIYIYICLLGLYIYIYIYIYIYSPNMPPFIIHWKKFLFRVSSVKSELAAIYFDISLFCFHCWKINGILSFLVSKSIMFRQCFSLELYIYNL